MIRILLVILFALIPATTASPSRVQRPQMKDYTLNVQVELVALPISVVDKDGYPVLGLKQEHFKVYEDRVMQDPVFFKQEDAPLSIGLVIDASGSMLNKQDRVVAAAMTFIQESNPEDETFIVSFSDRPNLEQNFTTDPGKLGSSLNRIVAHGATSLHDAVLFAAGHLEKGFHEKKALLVVSDGEDNKSRYKLAEVLEAIRESRTILYTVGLMSPDVMSMYNWPFKTKAAKSLEQFAKVTGGRAFFPKSLSDVDEVCRRIARDLRSQYTIGYRPSNDRLDGSWRKVKVQVSPPKGTSRVRVHTKQGYYAPSAQSSGRPEKGLRISEDLY